MQLSHVIVFIWQKFGENWKFFVIFGFRCLIHNFFFFYLFPKLFFFVIIISAELFADGINLVVVGSLAVVEEVGLISFSPNLFLAMTACHQNTLSVAIKSKTFETLD